MSATISLSKSLRALTVASGRGSFAVSKRGFVVSNAVHRGPPPLSIQDLYGLLYRYEPAKKTKDRPAAELFEDDLKLNEVMVYTNGPMNETKDDTSEACVLHIQQSNIVFYARNGSRPDFQEVLKKEAGTGELPQIWVQGKLAFTGKDCANFDKVYEATAPARRAWPRKEKAYYKGFYGYQGVTTSTECVNRPMQRQ